MRIPERAMYRVLSADFGMSFGWVSFSTQWNHERLNVIDSTALQIAEE
jgi:hypothetical protein